MQNPQEDEHCQRSLLKITARSPRPKATSALNPREITNEIGTPEPQLEPHITSFDKCNIDRMLLETQIYYISGVGVCGYNNIL